MKMANMDHVFDYMFTNPKDFQGVRTSFSFSKQYFLREEKLGRKKSP